MSCIYDLQNKIFLWSGYEYGFWLALHRSAVSLVYLASLLAMLWLALRYTQVSVGH